MDAEFLDYLGAVSDLGLCSFLVIYMVIRQDRLLKDLTAVCRDIKVILEQRRR